MIPLSETSNILNDFDCFFSLRLEKLPSVKEEKENYSQTTKFRGTFVNCSI